MMRKKSERRYGKSEGHCIENMLKVMDNLTRVTNVVLKYAKSDGYYIKGDRCCIENQFMIK